MAAATTDSVRIAPVRVKAGRDQRSRWQWGPRYDGGVWIIERDAVGRPPWAFRVDDDDRPEWKGFDSYLERVVYQLDHPDLMAVLAEAEPTTVLPGSPSALLDGPLTPERFAQLRSSAEQRRLVEWDRTHATVYSGYRRPLPEDGIMDSLRDLPEPVTQPAGSWVREDRVNSNGEPMRWHRFAGDLEWRPGSRDVAVGVSCRVGAVHLNLVWSEERPDIGICRWCERLIAS